MWRRAQINSPAGTVPISLASSGGSKIVRANLSLSANGLIDFQDGSSNSLNGGPIPLLAGYPFELGYVDNDDAQQNPVFQTGGAGGDAFPFTGAAIDWDFANGRYVPALGLTTTRASAAYIDNLAGLWISFPPGAARIANKGLLVEESRINDVLFNRDFTNVDWIKTNVIANLNQTGIDGNASSASSLLATAANATVLQPITLASSALTLSAFVRRIGGSGTINMTMDGGTTWVAVPVTSVFTRVVIPTQTIANPQVGFQIVTNGDAIAVDFVQLENGVFPTSPILTTAAAVTRAADVVTVTNPPAFGSAVTVFGAGVPIAPITGIANQTLIYVDDGTGNNRQSIYRNGSGGQAVGVMFVGGSPVAAPASVGVWAQNTAGKASFAIQPNDQALDFNGASPVATTYATTPAMNRVLIGSGGPGDFNGYITRVAVWPNQRLPNATLQSITLPGPANTNGLNLVIQGAGTCTGYVDYQLTSGN